MKVEAYIHSLKDRAHNRHVLGEAKIIKSRQVATLHCDNPDCGNQMLRKFVHFVGKKAMDISGLSEAILDKFISAGFLTTYQDLYHLGRYRSRKNNPHAHIVVPIRQIGENGFYHTKLETRQINTKRFLFSMREGWADIQNREYERMGLPFRGSHESLYVQGFDRKPTIHLSAKDVSFEKRGIETIRGNINRQILAENRAKKLQRQQERERNRQHERPRSYERSR